MTAQQTIAEIEQSLNLLQALRDAGLTEDLRKRLVDDSQFARSVVGFAAYMVHEGFADKQPLPIVFSASTTLEEALLSVRTYNCLKREGINTLGDVAKLSETQLMNVRNLGARSIAEIVNVLAQAGLSPRAK
jgi:DNA-directed RNA polymerase alpha subunit